ncbi:hypothetical protein FN846DRAFT_458554 [Sphaerosporella brunnea]|uniref:Uncharacterized protein n=1 Tax=Sphaerosporella brunnea TaxID=1250544 RepID=A0A5J5EE93_9PEZI|nr:hypothetical protein FN846DRAFT_458554 [Sphaerosporella brunnea]
MTEQEKDIYDFDLEDPPSPAAAPTKKRRRTVDDDDLDFEVGNKNLPARSRTMVDGDSDFEPTTKRKRQAAAKKTQQRSKTMPANVPAFDLTSEDEYEPRLGSKAAATPKGKKATRSNTDQQQLLPPIPKPKRKKRDLTKELQDFLPLPTANEDAGTEVMTSPQSAFMVDMTRDDLVFAEEKRQEYDNIFAVNKVLDNSDDSQKLESTIPDPPEVYLTLDPKTGLSREPEKPAPSPTVGIDSKDGSPSKPQSPPPAQNKKQQRSKTDTAIMVDEVSGGYRIASEWRAAKAKGRQNLSDKPGKQVQEQLDNPSILNEIHSDGGGRKTTKKKTPQPKKAKEKKEPAKKKGKKAQESEAIVIDESFQGTIEAEPTKPENPLQADDMVDELLGPTTVTPAPKPLSQKSTQEVQNTPPHSSPKDQEASPQLEEATEHILKKIGQKSRAKSNFNYQAEADSAAEKLEDPKPKPKSKAASAKRKRTKAEEEPADDYSAEEGAVSEHEKTKPTKRKRTATAKQAKEVPVADKDSEAEPQELKTPAPLPPAADNKSAKPGSHSPIRGGKLPYRVGLSKRARIQPLLSVRPRERKRPE